jgi:hypothetical protein
MTIVFTNEDYRTYNTRPTMMNRHTGTGELKRKQSDATKYKQHLPIENKVRIYSNNQVQNRVKFNFIIQFKTSKSTIIK